ncbi:MAG TPA: hypothetical protein VEY93_09210 [Longimicrobium sp.]|nr:hypothetical protein [Longimicrobium sp.]
MAESFRPPNSGSRGIRRVARLLLACIAVILSPHLADGQEHADIPRRQGLAGQTDAFLDLIGGRTDPLVAFFPRRGDWTWFHTVHQDGGPALLQVWRFPGGAAREAIKTCGPAWESFTIQYESHPVGVLSWHVIENGRRWRRVGGTRFVPPGASANSPVFVEWRREDGRWVLSAFGDETFHRRRLPGIASGMVRRDTTGPLPAVERFAAGQPWYESGRPITFEGLRYLRYGTARMIDRGELAWFGVLGAVRVYTLVRHSGDWSVIYLPVAAGVYQAYQTDQMSFCS